MAKKDKKESSIAKKQYDKLNAFEQGLKQALEKDFDNVDSEYKNILKNAYDNLSKDTRLIACINTSLIHKDKISSVELVKQVFKRYIDGKIRENKASTKADIAAENMYKQKLFSIVAQDGEGIIRALKTSSDKGVKTMATLILSELLDCYPSATYQNPYKDNKTIGMLALENGINDLNIKEAKETINKAYGKEILKEDVAEKCDSVLEKSNLVNETLELKDGEGKDIADYYFGYQKEIVEKEFEKEGRSKGLFNTAVKREADKRAKEGLEEAIETAEKVNEELDKASSGKNNKSNEGKEGK